MLAGWGCQGHHVVPEIKPRAPTCQACAPTPSLTFFGVWFIPTDAQVLLASCSEIVLEGLGDHMGCQALNPDAVGFARQTPYP